MLVVGGGITGSVLALALAQRGARVDLVEITPQWRGVGHGITVQGNLIAALRKVGVADEVMRRGVPFSQVRMRKADGSLIAEVPTPRTGGADLPATMGALRSDIQEILCEHVYAAGVTVRLGLSVRAIDAAAERAHVEFTDGSAGSYDLVVGADGIRSALRGMLGITTTPRPSGMSIWRVVADRPAEMDCAELYYDGPRYKAGYSPISATRCYAYLLDADGRLADFGDKPAWQLMYERSEGYGGTWGKIREAIGPDSNVSHTRIEWLLVDDPWYRGRAIVIGDAAHACPPLIAQGAAMCAEDAVRLTATVNEAVAAHCARGQGRLYGLGTLPLQHPALAVRELERAVRGLGLKGVSVSTSVAGRELADRAFDPVWEAAAGLGAVVFIHPWGCSLGSRLGAKYLGNTFGQPAETALALSHLIFGGTLDRHPSLKLLAAHGGGFLPTYIGRSDHAWANREDARGCARPPSEYLRQIWYDALVYTPKALRHLVEAAGQDRVVLGTDYPFDMGVTDPVRRATAAGLPAAGLAAILSGNAAGLLGI